MQRRNVLTFGMLGAAALTGCGATWAAEEARPASALAFTMKDIDGKEVPLKKFAGKAVMIVNVASQCGNTKQYAALQSLYEKYGKQGLVILGIPANDFGMQEPGTEQEIKEFCTAKYRVTFPMFSKVVVKGEGQTPLYQYLTSKETNPKFGGEVEWNFAKFLLNRKGEVIARFPARLDPASPEVVSAIEKALAEK